LIFDVYPAIITATNTSTSTLHPIDTYRPLLLQPLSNQNVHSITNRRSKYV